MPTEKEMEQMLGAIQSLEDYRYVNVEHLAGAAPEASAFPDSFHIDFSAVSKVNQRKIGSCTCQSTSEIKSHRDVRLGKALPRRTVGRFLYAMSKIEDGLPGGDTGTYCNQPLKIGVKYGCATEATVTEDDGLSFDDYIYQRDVKNIPAAAFAEADKNRIPGYAQVGKFWAVTPEQLKQAIMSSQDGVKICMSVGNEWWTDKNGNFSFAAADLLPIRPCVNRVSGHDVCATGWEMEGGRMKVFFRNHWGEEWGDHGDGYLWLDEHQLSESWVVTEIPDALLAIIKSLPPRSQFSPLFKNDLKPGQGGTDVQNLQIALKIFDCFPFTQPATNYFGPLTKAGVMKFQGLYKVASPAEIAAAGGAVGPKSRAILNKLLAQK